MWLFGKKKVKEDPEKDNKTPENESKAPADESKKPEEETGAGESIKPEEETGAGESDKSEEESGAGKSEENEVRENETRESENSENKTRDSEPKGFFARLKAGLAKTRDSFARSLSNAFTASEIDDDFYEELEEILIMADIGVGATENILDDLKKKVRSMHLKKTAECREILKDSIKAQMQVKETEYRFETETSIIMVIGVNGVGKTTTIGKLASKFKAQGRKVLIAAADTFRAAAGEQLEVWAERAGVPIVGSVNGADPASVVFDAVTASKARGTDVLLIDTAGRLHNKKNLMEELRKMDKIISREYPDAHRENLIVLDGTTGQNALVQAKEFSEVAPITGIVLTKMDGTAKGGIAVAIASELDIPVKYIGVGEKIEDLQKFDPDAFVEAIFE